MGGHVGGERASTLACNGFVEAYREDDGLTAEDRLVKALEKANEAIADEVRLEPALDGMGCTLVAASLDAGGLRWISVGDSHLFLYRRGELFLLNENHSLAPVLDRLAEEGQMSSQDALNHPRRHYLRSALTGEDIELVDLFAEGFPLKTGDWIILASDGIDTLPPEQITEIIERNAQHPAEKVATELVNATLAVDLPFQDNTTVMAISVHSR
jgi:protein phosphatase